MTSICKEFELRQEKAFKSLRRTNFRPHKLLVGRQLRTKVNESLLRIGVVHRHVDRVELLIGDGIDLIDLQVRKL